MSTEVKNAYRVRHDVITSTAATKGQIVNGDDYPELERLIRVGALEPMPGVEIPKRDSSPEELLEDVQNIHEKCVAQQAEIDQLKAGLRDEQQSHAKTIQMTGAEMDACYKRMKEQEGELVVAQKRAEAFQDEIAQLKARIQYLESNFPENADKPDPKKKK